MNTRKNLYHIIHPFNFSEIRSMYQQSFATGSNCTLEVVFRFF